MKVLPVDSSEPIDFERVAPWPQQPVVILRLFGLGGKKERGERGRRTGPGTTGEPLKFSFNHNYLSVRQVQRQATLAKPGASIAPNHFE